MLFLFAVGPSVYGVVPVSPQVCVLACLSTGSPFIHSNPSDNACQPVMVHLHVLECMSVYLAGCLWEYCVSEDLAVSLGPCVCDCHCHLQHSPWCLRMHRPVCRYVSLQKFDLTVIHLPICPSAVSPPLSHPYFLK